MGEYTENLECLLAAAAVDAKETAFQRLVLSADPLRLSAGCSLDTHPTTHNWLEEVGGLPLYLCRIASALVRNGHSISDAISIAVSRCEVWATGVGVSKATQAKASAAIAEWNAKRAASHAKTLAKNAAHAVSGHKGSDTSKDTPS